MSTFLSPKRSPPLIPILAQREGVVSYVSHNEFLKMLDKAWYEKEKTSANVMAVLKRTHILLRTKHLSMFVRPVERNPPSSICPSATSLGTVVQVMHTATVVARGRGQALQQELQVLRALKDSRTELDVKQTAHTQQEC